MDRTRLIAGRLFSALMLSTLSHCVFAQIPVNQTDDALRAKILKTADSIEIQSVIAQYVAILDADAIAEPEDRRVTRFTHLFTPDGIWTEHLWNAGKPMDDGPGCFVQGQAQLTRFAQVLFGNIVPNPAATARHNLVTPLIEISGDNAKAAINWIQTRDAILSEGRVDLLATGRYYLALKRQDSGWAISKLDLMSDHPLYGTSLGPPCSPTGPQ